MRGNRTVGINDGKDVGQYAIEVGQHLVVPVTEHNVAHGFELGGAVGITGGHAGHRVLAAIEFHDDVMFKRREVDHVAADRHLPFELQPVLLTTAER